MKKKGFTLIEMLGVIVIISIIALVLIPIVTKNIKDSKQDVYNNLIDKMLVATSDWMVKNTEILPSEGESISITLGMLQSEGLISTDLKNPNTDNLFPADMVINISYVKSNRDNPKLTYGKYKGDYSIVVDVNSGTEIKDIKDEYTVIQLGLSDNELDSIIYKDKDNNDITMKEYSIQVISNGLKKKKLDSSKIGIYAFGFVLILLDSIITSLFIRSHSSEVILF